MLEETFDKTDAPGQSSALKKYFLLSENEEEIFIELKNMIKLYKNNDNVDQTVILSLVDKPKERNNALFGCSKYKVDQVSILKKLSKALNILKYITHNRQQLNQLECQWFINGCSHHGWKYHHKS